MKLSLSDYQVLFEEIKKNGFLTMCTPFDEISVDHVMDMNFDLKIKGLHRAPLMIGALEIGEVNLPTVISTGNVYDR